MASKRTPKSMLAPVAGHTKLTVAPAGRSGSELPERDEGNARLEPQGPDPIAQDQRGGGEAGRRAPWGAGYVERTGSNEWLTTDSGAVASGSKPPRFTPEAVESALSALAERIKAANYDPNAPFHIGKAAGPEFKYPMWVFSSCQANPKPIRRSQRRITQHAGTS